MNQMVELTPRKRLLSQYERLKAEGCPVALILANLDRFKGVNLEIGHMAADEVLEEAEAILLRGGHSGARIGGDLFAILRQSDLARARQDADILRNDIAETTFAHGVRLTASFGVVATDKLVSFEDLLHQAEACLYAAKAKGRDRVVDGEEFAALAGLDEELLDNDNKTRVLTDRLGHALLLRAHKIAGRLRGEADHDGLTGIFNRRYFDRRLDCEFESAWKFSKPLSIVLLDLDHFGDVNRRYGYPAGDRALKTLADVLQRCLRPTDWAARYGGEEFCLILPGASAREACVVAARVRAALADQSVAAHDGTQFRITASQGVVELLPSDRDTTDLVQRASDKVRQAKNEGRDRICV